MFQIAKEDESNAPIGADAQRAPAEAAQTQLKSAAQTRAQPGFHHKMQSEEAAHSDVARDEALSLQSPRRKGLWAARLLCGLLLVAALLWRHEQGGNDWQSTASAWKLVSWPVLPLAVAWYWAGQVMSAWKWRLLLRAQGALVSLRECCRWYAVGMFWNLWMPTNIGGDAVRVYLAAPRCGGRAVAAASVLVERLTGFLALLAIGSIALIADATRSGIGNRAVAMRASTAETSLPTTSASGALASGGMHSGQATRLLFAALGVLLALVLLWLLVGFVTRRLEARAPANVWVRRVALVRRTLESHGRREMRPVLVWSLLLSLVFQASQIALNIGLARAVGLDVRAEVFWWLVPLLALASLLPVGIGGLGVREAAAVALLAGSGAATPTIVLWSLLWQATVWIASLPGIFWRSPPLRNDASDASKAGASDANASGAAA